MNIPLLQVQYNFRALEFPLPNKMKPENRRNMRHSLNMHPVQELETTFLINSRHQKSFFGIENIKNVVF
jgi:hypothetical protein